MMPTSSTTTVPTVNEEVGPSNIREQIVRPKNNWFEIGIVAYAMVVIAILGGYRWLDLYAATTAQAAKGEQDVPELSAQASYYHGSALAALGDIEFYLNESGKLPEAAILAEDGIAPFDLSFAPVEHQGMSWNTAHHTTWVDYVIAQRGNETKAAAQVPSFVLRVIDLHADYHPHPHPGTDYDPKQRLAFQLFEAPDLRSRYPGERLMDAGWIWRNRPANIIRKP